MPRESPRQNKGQIPASAEAAGLQGNYGLHSLRAGGASAAANAGVPDRLFKRHGRWRSETAKDGYLKESLSDLLTVSQSLKLWEWNVLVEFFLFLLALYSDKSCSVGYTLCKYCCSVVVCFESVKACFSPAERSWTTWKCSDGGKMRVLTRCGLCILAHTWCALSSVVISSCAQPHPTHRSLLFSKWSAQGFSSRHPYFPTWFCGCALALWGFFTLCLCSATTFEDRSVVLCFRWWYSRSCISLEASSSSYYSITTVGAQSLYLLFSCGKKNIPCGMPSCSVAIQYANIVALLWCAMRVRIPEIYTRHPILIYRVKTWAFNSKAHDSAKYISKISLCWYFNFTDL